MNVAIVYDRVNKFGGAEKVILALNELFPQAPLYTSVYDSSKASWARIFPEVIPSFLQKLPFMQDKHEFLGVLTPIAFESFNFGNYDLVISVTSEAAKGIITSPKTVHICYCLTPTRYLWSHYNIYFKDQILRTSTKPLVGYLRNWDKIAAQRPDVMIAISTEVQSRIKKYYGRDSQIVYPPVDVEKFNKYEAGSKSADKNYYLIFSRLVPYKRIDLALEAFAKLGLKLIVAGIGSEEAKYKSKYKSFKNIIFKGFVGDKELVDLYHGAIALVFPGEEDFGIVMVEAQAAGIPVIAYKKGGALDIVKEGKTGIFFEDQSVESLVGAIKYFSGSTRKSVIDHLSKWELSCIENAKRFSKQRFMKEFQKVVTDYKKIIKEQGQWNG